MVKSEETSTQSNNSFIMGNNQKKWIRHIIHLIHLFSQTLGGLMFLSYPPNFLAFPLNFLIPPHLSFSNY